MKLLHRLSALAMTAVMAFSISGGVFAADAAMATIDTSRSASLTLYKYDLTGAENDGVWNSQSYVSTSIADEQVNTALSQYAIQGVEFSYRKLADLSIYKGTAADGHQETVPLYAFTENTKSGSKETIDFLSALGLTTNDAYRTDHDGKQNRVWYFKSDVLVEALDHALQTNATSTKDALEKYMAANGGTAGDGRKRLLQGRRPCSGPLPAGGNPRTGERYLHHCTVSRLSAHDHSGRQRVEL